MALLASSLLAAGSDGTSDRAAELARASVAARFVADPRDSGRDLVTGRSREDLEREALAYYDDVEAGDQARFDRLEGRTLGARTAAELLDRGAAELASGRRASAQITWTRLAEEYPESPQAGTAMLHLASLREQEGDLVGATRWLARLPELHVQEAVQAAPLMQRLLEDIDGALARDGGRISGRDEVRLHPSLGDLDLDRARELSEWASGFQLVDEIARSLRLETSGDLLRRIKKLGEDSLRLDGIVALIPRRERVAAIRAEEQLADPSDPRGVARRIDDRTRGKLDRLEDLARIQKLQVILLARSIRAAEIEPAAARLGARSLAARRGLVTRVEALGRQAGERSPEDAAVARLFAIADVDDNRRLTPLFDDEGLLRRKRFAVEGDMRNAVDKPLDDDNARAVTDLFERTGLSEKALFLSLVRATAVPTKDGRQRVDPSRVATLLARLRERGGPAWHAANPGQGEPLVGPIERDYIARLNVLREPGMGLDQVLEREVLGDRVAPPTVHSALAGDPRGSRLLAELASLGTRRDGAWILEDDAGAGIGSARAMTVAATADTAPRTARAKLARAGEIKRELDDIAATRALSSMTTTLVSDLESQGMRFSPGDVEAIEDKVSHEDLGTLALTFDEWGSFSGVRSLVGFTQPGTSLGQLGPGHVAWGFGLDVLSGSPAGTLGWRAQKELQSGTVLRYHFGGVGGLGGASDVSGVSARFRPRSVWQPELGADVSVVRGLAGRGFLNLIRDVNVKHERKLATLFTEEDESRRRGREAFVATLSRDDAKARPAVLFTQSLGWSHDDLLSDAGAYQVLSDAYEYERTRQVSQFHRDAWKVRFAGIGIDAAFLGGDLFLLAGPKLAIKDFKLFSHFIEGADRSVQSEEAALRREMILLPPIASERRETRMAALAPLVDSDGRSGLVTTHAESRLEMPEGDRGPEGGQPGGQPDGRRPVQIASLGTVAIGAAEESPRVDERRGDAAIDESGAIDSLNAALLARGVAMSLGRTNDPCTFDIVPRATTPWAAQSVEMYVANQPGIGVSLAAGGQPQLVAPRGGAGVVIDWMEEVRSVTRGGEADEVHRIAFSLAPGRPAAEIIESSSHVLRAEMVDGELIGCARIATNFTDRVGRPVARGPVVVPDDADAPQRLARFRDEALASKAAAAPPPPARYLRPEEPGDAQAALMDPAALDPAFVDGLRHATRDDLLAVKRAGIAHARLVSLGERDERIEAETLDYIQSKSIAAHGRPLAGAALERAHFVLVHDGLFRADQGPVDSQIRFLEERAITPFAPDREIGGAPDPLTRRLMELAGVDEPAALADIQAGVKSMIGQARRTGRLERASVPAGTRIVTASWSEARGERAKGVQWTTAMEPVEAHLLADLPLSSNSGKYVAALAIGPDLPALDRALRRELDEEGDLERHRFDLDEDLLPAIARALASPADDRTLVARVAGLDVTLSLAEPPRAGALTRCKNATIFAPPYGARLDDEHDVVVATMPAALVGTAEAHSRFVGRPWVGWRRLSLLAGAPFILDEIFGGGGSRGSGVTTEPPPTPENPGPRAGSEPPAGGRPGRPDTPGRPGAEPPEAGDGGPPRPGIDAGSGGRAGRPGTPGRPVDDVEPPDVVDDGRSGTNPPAGGARGRPGTPRVPGTEPKPPRGRDEPPPGDQDPRPRPPEPPDRPRRPVD